MNKLCKEDKKTINAFLTIPIPKYIREYNDGIFDLMDCYEVAFTFANDLLRGKRIDPNSSPWGDGKSVIFDDKFLELLLNITKDNLSCDIYNYCQLFLKVLDIFKLFISSTGSTGDSTGRG